MHGANCVAVAVAVVEAEATIAADVCAVYGGNVALTACGSRLGVCWLLQLLLSEALTPPAGTESDAVALSPSGV